MAERLNGATSSGLGIKAGPATTFSRAAAPAGRGLVGPISPEITSRVSSRASNPFSNLTRYNILRSPFSTEGPVRGITRADFRAAKPLSRPLSPQANSEQGFQNMARLDISRARVTASEKITVKIEDNHSKGINIDQKINGFTIDFGRSRGSHRVGETLKYRVLGSEKSVTKEGKTAVPEAFQKAFRVDAKSTIPNRIAVPEVFQKAFEQTRLDPTKRGEIKSGTVKAEIPEVFRKAFAQESAKKIEPNKKAEKVKTDQAIQAVEDRVAKLKKPEISGQVIAQVQVDSQSGVLPAVLQEVYGLQQQVKEVKKIDEVTSASEPATDKPKTAPVLEDLTKKVRQIEGQQAQVNIRLAQNPAAQAEVTQAMETYKSMQMLVRARVLTAAQAREMLSTSVQNKDQLVVEAVGQVLVKEQILEQIDLLNRDLVIVEKEQKTNISQKQETENSTEEEQEIIVTVERKKQVDPLALAARLEVARQTVEAAQEALKVESPQVNNTPLPAAFVASLIPDQFLVVPVRSGVVQGTNQPDQTYEEMIGRVASMGVFESREQALSQINQAIYETVPVEEVEEITTRPVTKKEEQKVYEPDDEYASKKAMILSSLARLTPVPDSATIPNSSNIEQTGESSKS